MDKEAIFCSTVKNGNYNFGDNNLAIHIKHFIKRLRKALWNSSRELSWGNLVHLYPLLIIRIFITILLLNRHKLSKYLKVDSNTAVW